MTHQVAVRFLGYLERVAGQREVCLAVGGSATVLDVLNLLGERFGPKFVSSVFRAPGQVHTHLRIFLNEEEAEVEHVVAAVDGGRAALALLVMPIFEGG